ncbi:hypothetical protein D3C76_1182530 [compost metagenome]
MVMETPVPDGEKALDYFDNLYTSTTLKTKEIDLISKERIITDPQALLIKCTIAQGITWTNQWIYLLESPDNKIAQIQVTGQGKFNLIENEITDMLLTFKWTDEVADFETYYSIDLPKGWKLAKQYGVMELYSESGNFPLGKNESSLAVTTIHQVFKDKERDTYMENMNLHRRNYSDLKLISSELFYIDESLLFLSYVSGIETKTSKQVTKQYCYIFLDNITVMIEADRTEIMDQETFRKTIASWKLKDI